MKKYFDYKNITILLIIILTILTLLNPNGYILMRSKIVYVTNIDNICYDSVSYPVYDTSIGQVQLRRPVETIVGLEKKLKYQFTNLWIQC